MGWTQVGTIIGQGGSGGGGIPAQRGADGATLLTGQGAPSLLLGKVGDLYFQQPPPDTIQLASGNLLQRGLKGDPGPSVAGPPGKNIKSDGGLFIPPRYGDWTYTLNNSTTATNNGDNIVLYSPTNTGDLFSYALKAVPTAPYKAIFYMVGFLPLSNFSSHGVMWYDSVAQHLKCLDVVYSSGIQIEVGKNITTTTANITADYTAFLINEIPRWFKLEDDNTNQIFSISYDGVNWIDIVSHARNTDVTPNKIGWFINVRNAASQAANVALWSCNI